MRTPVAVLLAATLAGCDLTATAEADSVCVTGDLATQQVPAALGAADVTDFQLPGQLQLQLDLGSAVPDLGKKGITTELVAQSLGITSREGADFSGLRSVSLVVVAPGKPDVAFTYTRAGAPPVPLTVAAAAPSARVDLVQYLQNGRTLQIKQPSFSGRLPSTSWTPAVRTCAAPKVEADAVKAAGL